MIETTSSPPKKARTQPVTDKRRLENVMKRNLLILSQPCSIFSSIPNHFPYPPANLLVATCSITHTFSLSLYLRLSISYFITRNCPPSRSLLPSITLFCFLARRSSIDSLPSSSPTIPHPSSAHQLLPALSYQINSHVLVRQNTCFSRFYQAL